MDRVKQYEKIRTVGKGAFGIANLYRKIKTNQLVVLKEVNINDLSPTEKEMALNEVQVLSSLNHPNIIAYGGSFEHQGTLMIEMEYADGGTLAQFLSNKDSNFPERQILNLLIQMCSAIDHMHSNNILHRDLKTANVFMNANGNLKIGDFGISKILTTNAQAQTVLGTPYYLSPEMCEGKDYNKKSDIWAMGCILYEMCCLHRTFQASSLPALVNKIMKAEYKPIPSGYSKNLDKLVKELLEKIPDDRPTAKEVLEERIPFIISSLGESGYEYIDPYNKKSVQYTKSERSILYQLKSFQNNTNIYSIQLPPRAKIKHLSTGENHFIVITHENIVYTWGEGIKGQLGHGINEQWLQYPTIIEKLVGKNIIMSDAGNTFSVFLSQEGKIYTCGDGSNGALGHANWNDNFEPKLIESVSGVKFIYISCGSGHVAALSYDHQVYTWGLGKKGQTGHKDTINVCTPKSVFIPQHIQIISIRCGGESTFGLTTTGKLIACGWNINNKLAMSKNYKLKKLSDSKSDIISEMKVITSIPGTVVDYSVGIMHCAIRTEITQGNTAVYTTGYPFHCDNISKDFNYSISRVTDLDNVKIMMIKCGPTYTVIGTDDNCILFWGTRYGIKEGELNMGNSQESSGIWSQSSNQKRTSVDDLSINSASTFTKYLTSTYLPETINKTINLLALYSSPSQLASGIYIKLENLYPLAHSILLVINTTAPLPKMVNLNKTNEENELTLQDCDSIGPLPDWMKSEIGLSQFPWTEHN